MCTPKIHWLLGVEESLQNFWRAPPSPLDHRRNALSITSRPIGRQHFWLHWNKNPAFAPNPKQRPVISLHLQCLLRTYFNTQLILLISCCFDLFPQRLHKMLKVRLLRSGFWNNRRWVRAVAQSVSIRNAGCTDGRSFFQMQIRDWGSDVSRLNAGSAYLSAAKCPWTVNTNLQLWLRSAVIFWIG